MDRNIVGQLEGLASVLSLSARRAWIEITYSDGVVSGSGVALRKESVDRNKYVVQCRKVFGVSLSARRAWIEISITI